MGKTEKELEDIEAKLKNHAKDLEAQEKKLEANRKEFSKEMEEREKAFKADVEKAHNEFEKHMENASKQLVGKTGQAGPIITPQVSVFKSGPTKEEIAIRAEKAQAEAEKAKKD